MIVTLIIGILCFLFSIVFFLGKGKNLIAGYNTASKEEQEKYDEKKLNLVMAIGMLVLGIIMAAMFFLTNVLPDVKSNKMMNLKATLESPTKTVLTEFILNALQETNVPGGFLKNKSTIF